MLLFIKDEKDIKIVEKMYLLLLEKIHKKYKKEDFESNIEEFIKIFIEKFNKYNQNTESQSYTTELFLTPKNVLKYIENNKNIINITNYIDIIEYVLINSGYKINKKSEILKIINKKCKILVNNANIKTLKLLSKQIYSKNLSILPKNEDTQQYNDIYKKIIN